MAPQHEVGHLGREAGGRLVKEHHGRFGYQRSSDGEQLALAAAQPPGDAIRETAQEREGVEDLPHPLCDLLAWEHVPAEFEVFADGECREHVIQLRDPRESAPHELVALSLRDVFPAQQHPAAKQLRVVRDAAQQRALAGAIWANQASDLAGGDGERHVVHHLVIPIARADTVDHQLGARGASRQDRLAGPRDPPGTPPSRPASALGPAPGQ